MIEEFMRVRPARTSLLGSMAADSDRSALLGVFERVESRNLMVDFDFAEVAETNGSYLRATVLWAINCGVASIERAQVGNATDPSAIRPYPLFPVVSNCCDAVVEELIEFLVPRNCAVLLRLSGEDADLKEAAVVGRLDGFLASTLYLLAELGEGTANQLLERSVEKISVNGWSNRLIDLLKLRLVSRRRDGKFWIYQPLSKSIKLWA